MVEAVLVMSILTEAGLSTTVSLLPLIRIVRTRRIWLLGTGRRSEIALGVWIIGLRRRLQLNQHLGTFVG